jgi:AcrR family transcriptional regulator
VTVGPAREGTPAKKQKPQRTHRGRTLDERRAERRSALLDAGLELFGTKGYSATSIGELCRVSFVATRYFYEEYGDRESLLLELYETLIEQIRERVLGVSEPPGPDHEYLAARARIAAFVHGAALDERVARVLLLESGSPRLEARRLAAHRDFARYVAQFALAYVDAGRIEPDDYELLALMFVGAVNEVITHWVLSPPDERADLDHVIDRLAEAYLAPIQARAGRTCATAPAAEEATPPPGATLH